MRKIARNEWKDSKPDMKYIPIEVDHQLDKVTGSVLSTVEIYFVNRRQPYSFTQNTLYFGT